MGKLNTDIHRQAIVVIHGVGEQRPMETLRRFVSGFLDVREYYSKPEEFSDLYDLRRIKVRPEKIENRIEENPDTGEKWPATDFFEYYWAHRLRGNTLYHLLKWLVPLFWYGLMHPCELSDKKTNRRYRHLVWGTALVLVGLMVCVIYLDHIAAPVKPWVDCAWLIVKERVTSAPWSTVAFALILILCLPAFFKFVGKSTINVICDPARYLDASPANVEARYQIIRGGVDLLRKLHNERKPGSKTAFAYDRVVVVGHSLGSVIAYDILKHYWHELHREIPVGQSVALAEQHAKRIENLPKEENGKVPKRLLRNYLNAQYELWCQMKRTRLKSEKKTTPRWLVSDFITLGSPLTYANFLLTRSPKDFSTACDLRELPINPPDRSTTLDKGSFAIPFSRSKILLHSSVFAMTRWTNLYFSKDPIGGPVAKVFGPGIRDKRVNGDRSYWWCINAHTGYWPTKTPNPSSNRKENPHYGNSIKELETILLTADWELKNGDDS